MERHYAQHCIRGCSMSGCRNRHRNIGDLLFVLAGVGVDLARAFGCNFANRVRFSMKINL